MADAHSTQSRDRAVGLFTHYFRTVFRSYGLKWDGDSDAEIAEAVDEVIDAAKREAVAAALAAVDRRMGRE